MNQEQIEKLEMPAHAHHWIIEEPTGPVSRGVCRRCGTVRQFRNWLGEDDFLTNEEQRVLHEAA